MLDIGWTELLVIAVILIVVVGPKDLPPMIRTFGKMTKRLRQTAGEFRAQFDEALREAELDDLKNSVNDIRSLNPANSIRETLNPLRQMGQEIRSDLERSTRPDAKPAALDEAYEHNSILPDTPLGLGEPPKELRPAAQQPVAPTSTLQTEVATAVSSAPTAAAPATSAPAAMPMPVAEKRPASRKPAPAKADAPAKAADRSAKPARAVAPSSVDAKPTQMKTKAVAGKSAGVKSAPAEKAVAKPASKPRKIKSEDGA